jgi:two-component system nitrogen regulation response regulator GlnG
VRSALERLATPGVDGSPRALARAVRTLADRLLTTRPGRIYREMQALVERPLLAHVLALTGGNQVRAARLLGLNRNTLHKHCQRLRLLPSSRVEVRTSSRRLRSAPPG